MRILYEINLLIRICKKLNFLQFLKVGDFEYDPEEHSGIKTNPFDENGMIMWYENSQVAPFMTELTIIKSPIESGHEPETVEDQTQLKGKQKRHPRKPKRRKPRRKIISIYD